MNFKPAWWLPGPHLQTIWPTLCRRAPEIKLLKRERIELPDGDFIDLDWAGEGSGPIVLVLHGLEGSIKSSYTKGMLHAMTQHGWRAVLMHFRSCSGEMNRLPRTYHSGETSDIAAIVQLLHEREPQTILAAVGFSLGGNVLLKWLGETGQHTILKAAIAISVPFELHKSADKLQKGFSQFYQWYLLRSLKAKIKLKSISCVTKLNTLRAFDNNITAPLHGFADADEYYQLSSSRQYLQKICIPTLLVQANNDPFITHDAIPEKHELSPHVMLEITKGGGHVGFITGRFPWNARYWLEQRVPEFFQAYLNG